MRKKRGPGSAASAPRESPGSSVSREEELQASQLIEEGYALLAETAKGLPTTWKLILDTAQHHKLGTVLVDSSAPAVQLFERRLFVLKSLVAEWEEGAENAHTLPGLTQQARATLGGVTFARRFLLEAVQVFHAACTAGEATLRHLNREQTLRAVAQGRARIQRGTEILVLHHIRLVHGLAARYRRYGVHGAGLEDLIQEGCLGLLHAAERFDPRKARFKTYAEYWVRQAMSRVLAGWGRVVARPTREREHTAAVARKARWLESVLGRTPTPEEVAAAFGYALPEVTRGLGGTDRDVSIETLVGEDLTLGDLIADQEATAVFAAVDAQDDLDDEGN